MKTLTYDESVRAFELGYTVAICTPLGTICYGHDEIALEMDAQMAFDLAERRQMPMVLVESKDITLIDIEPIPVEVLGKRAEMVARRGHNR